MECAVRFDHVTMAFPGVLANDDISLEIRPGEVFALVGENGAGKSTLMNLLYGIHTPTEGESLELERRLTEDHYLELLEEADTSLRSLYKTRYFLAYDRQYFVIDLFPFWHEQAILSVQIPSEDAEIRFPEEIHVIREITDEEEFRNHYLAMRVA